MLDKNISKAGKPKSNDFALILLALDSNKAMKRLLNNAGNNDDRRQPITHFVLFKPEIKSER
jgi:hypothetical protein